jgi:hypothetical protein
VSNHYLALNLAVPWGELTIHPRSDYEERLEGAKGGKRVEVTAEGWAIPHDLAEQELEKHLEETCRILSLCRGTKVNWVNLEGVSAQGKRVNLCLLNCITRPFSIWPLILPNDQKDTAEFVKRAYPNYLKLRDEYNLDIACEMFLDAKNEAIYLQSRALIAVALLDFLQSQYAEKNDLTSIVSVSRHLLDYLRPKLTDILGSFGCSEDDCKEILGKLPELNRRSYLSVMKKWLTSLKVPYTDEELSRVRDSRHSLAHSLQFCGTNDGDKIREYMRILGLLHRTLLRLLDYSGNYVDFDLDLRRIKVASLD